MSSSWSTGPVGTNHRAVLRAGRVVAVAESVEEAALIVRRMNEADRADARRQAEQDMETIPL